MSDLGDLKCDLCDVGRCDPDESVRVGDRVVFVCFKCHLRIPAADATEIIETILAGDKRSRQHVAFTAMIVAGRPPLAVTDDTFFNGWHSAGGAQFGNANRPTREGYLGEARRAGVSTNGKVYMHGLADYPGDPRAWVSTRGEIVKRLEERGWGCDRLGVKARNDLPPAPDVPLADDIVDEFVEKRIASEGIDRKRLTPTRLAEMREQVIDTHGRKKEPTVTRPRKKKRAKR